MFFTIALFVICILLYVLERNYDSYWKKKKVVYEKPLPIVGNILEVIFLRKSIGNKVKELYFKFDRPYFGIWLFNKPQLIAKCPDLIKQILVKDFDHFNDRNITCEEGIDNFSANMTFFMKNPKWKVVRAKTTAMFSSAAIKSMYPEIDAIAKNAVEYINAKDEPVLEVKDICVKYANAAVCSIAFGIDAKSFEKGGEPLITIARTAFTLTLLNAISMLSHFGKSSLLDIFKFKLVKSSIARYLKNFFLDIFEKRKALTNPRKIFLDFIIKLKNESRLCDDEIIGQASQFLIAGHETVSSTVSLAIYELSINRNVQEKLREEIRSNLEIDGTLTYGSLSTMDYLDKIVYETLRKYPVVPFLGRTCTKDYVIPETAIVLEKGVDVIISVLGLHHDPKYFPNPELFDPERFSIENVRRRHPYCYLPFGEGQRSCVGQRVGVLLTKLALAHIIKTFDIEISKEKTNTPLEFRTNTFSMSVKGDIYVNFKKID